ncbi:MAG: hypothetical protein HZB76_03065 [Chlamydiae bacterium]|nr:hypothetical protein [Chlamydiota bacterium]
MLDISVVLERHPYFFMAGLTGALFGSDFSSRPDLKSRILGLILNFFLWANVYYALFGSDSYIESYKEIIKKGSKSQQFTQNALAILLGREIIPEHA